MSVVRSLEFRVDVCCPEREHEVNGRCAMKIDRAMSLGRGDQGSVPAVTRPQLRWTTVTGPDGRARLEMRWDVASPRVQARPAA